MKVWEGHLLALELEDPMGALMMVHHLALSSEVWTDLWGTYNGLGGAFFLNMA